MQFHQGKILKRTYLQVRNILVWIHQVVKNLKNRISSSGVESLA
jgi:hypothetical protein